MSQSVPQSSAQVKVSKDVWQQVHDTYGLFTWKTGKIDPVKSTDDVLSSSKVDEQVALLERFSGQSIRGKKILEVGSGFGVFLVVTKKKYGAEPYGIEPSEEGFDGSFGISQKILEANGIDPKIVTEGVGESLPYPDSCFDFVFSTNVLEHVRDPKAVLAEAIRVCRPGGFIQVVVPSYGSFYDGHYACLYIPYQPKWFWSLWLKYGLKRDPTFAKTLRTEINYFSIKNILRPYIDSGEIEFLGMGEEVFRERMTTLKFTPYAGLTKIRKLLELAHRLKIVTALTWFLLLIKAQSPLIISIRKKV